MSRPRPELQSHPGFPLRLRSSHVIVQLQSRYFNSATSECDDCRLRLPAKRRVGQMSEPESISTRPVGHRRQSKFTPTGIRQIVNPVERGKSKQEIAEVIGVTVATLQVTCSKPGISLRRPEIASRSGLSRLPRASIQSGKTPYLHKTSDLASPIREAPQPEARNQQIAASSVMPLVNDDRVIVQLKRNELRSPHRFGSDGITPTMRSRGKERAVIAGLVAPMARWICVAVQQS
jgi:hypothetical protein